MSAHVAPFDPTGASDEIVRECYELVTEAFKLEYPDRPVPDFDAYAAQIRNPRSMLGPRRLWLARDAADEAVVGMMAAVFPENENRHLAIVQVRVAPSRRREGIGSELFRAVLPAVREAGREVIGTEGLKVGADGEKWAAANGFERVSELIMQRLKIDDSTSKLWPTALPAGFHAEFHVGSVPEHLTAECADVLASGDEGNLAQATRREREWTADRLRVFETDIRERGNTLWIALARRDDDANVAAITMIEVSSTEPEHGYQQETVVAPQWRGEHLAFALKAAMLRELTSRHREVKQIFAHMESTNEAMIHTNERLGYQTEDKIARFEARVADLA